MPLVMCFFVLISCLHKSVMRLIVSARYFDIMKLDSLLDRLDVQAAPFALCRLQGRTHLGLGQGSQATLHYVLSGTGEVMVKGHPALPLTPGSLVLVPALLSHTLWGFGGTGPALPQCHAAELGLDLHDIGTPGEDGGSLLALCSHVNVGLRNTGNLIDLIREPIVERIDPTHALSGTIQRLTVEVMQPRIGGKSMVRILMLECILDLLRGRIEAHDPSLEWLHGLEDEGLWAALQVMLDQPGAPHSVESLAREAGMSRSSFADRFQSTYGRGPMDLLRGVRMRKAAELLERRNMPIDRVAGLVGFKSRSAFSRCFQASTGQSPRDFRAARS